MISKNLRTRRLNSLTLRASTSGLDLLFVRQAVRRIESSEAADYREVASWVQAERNGHAVRWVNTVCSILSHALR